MVTILGGFFLFAPTVQAEEFAADSDGDGLIDQQETNRYYTDPQNSDTDKDGISDGAEITAGTSPHAAKKKLYENDYDGDGFNDWLELAFGTDLGKTDTDGDGHNDFTEVMHGYSPLDQSPLATLPRRVEVDLTTQRMFYIVDEKKVKEFPVSTGNPQTPTPPGTYEISRMLPVARYKGADYDLANVKWNMQFRKGGYFLHGAYWHNDFGKRTRSHGCVNMRTADAGWLYQYMKPGVAVIIKGTTPKNGMVKK